MLPKSRGVFFAGKKSPCGMSLDHGVLGGTLKSMKIDNIRKIHAQATQGCDFLIKKNASGRIIDHGVLGGTLNSMNIENPEI